MPALIILSPRTTKMKQLESLPINSAGNGYTDSICSSATIGSPARTAPTIGIGTIFFLRQELSSTTSIARELAGSFLIMPISSNRARYPCTVEVDRKPTAVQISRTVGGNPSCQILLRIKSRIVFSLVVNSLCNPNFLATSRTSFL